MMVNWLVAELLPGCLALVCALTNGVTLTNAIIAVSKRTLSDLPICMTASSIYLKRER